MARLSSISATVSSGACRRGLDRAPLESEAYRPRDLRRESWADGYDAEILRPAALAPLAAARRKVEVERLARIAMRRHTAADRSAVRGARFAGPDARGN